MTFTPLRIAFQIAVSALWLGLIVALSFIETPLKFQAPGMTLPVALGVGRLVFNASNIAGIVLALALTLSMARRGMQRSRAINLAAIWGVLSVEVAVLRPLLAERTNRVMAGVSSGGSAVHIWYIVCECALVALLVWSLISSARALRSTPRA